MMLHINMWEGLVDTDRYGKSRSMVDNREITNNKRESSNNRVQGTHSHTWVCIMSVVNLVMPPLQASWMPKYNIGCMHNIEAMSGVNDASRHSCYTDTCMLSML